MPKDPEERVADLFHNIGICYSRLNRNASLPELGIGEDSGHHAELDGFCNLGTLGLIVEVTEQRTRPSAKINRYLANLTRVLPALEENTEHILRTLSEHPNRLPDTSSIEEWRAMFIGLAPEYREFDTAQYTYGRANRELDVMDDGEFHYLESLDRIPKVAQNEFFAKLGLSPQVLNPQVSRRELQYDALRVTGRKLGHEVAGAEVYLTYMPANELVGVARTIRYQGIPLVGTAKSSGYQRPLNPKRLRAIADVLDSTFTFPNTVTVLLGSECCFEPTGSELGEKVEKGSLTIPDRYGMLDVVDGQHRIFAFALEGTLDTQVSEGSVLGVTAVHLPEATAITPTEYAARLFIDINREQRRVGKLQLQLMAYDVLGERNSEAVTAKVLRDLNLDKQSPYANLLRTEIYEQAGGPSIAPLTVIGETATAIKRLHGKAEASPEWADSWNVPGEAIEELDVQFTKLMLERIGSILKRELSEDWGDERSRLMYSKPLAAALRLSGEIAVNNSWTPNELKHFWRDVASNFRRIAGGESGDLVFPHDAGDTVGGHAYPNARRSVGDFMDFFRDLINENGES